MNPTVLLLPRRVGGGGGGGDVFFPGLLLLQELRLSDRAASWRRLWQDFNVVTGQQGGLHRVFAARR